MLGALLLSLLFVLAPALPALAQTPFAPPAPSTAPARQAPPASREVAGEWYRKHLPKDLTGDDLDRLYRTHLLIEEFFADGTPGARREQLIREVEATGTSPDEVAVLCRLRLGWRAVDPGVYYVNDRVGPVPVRYFVAVPAGYDPSAARPVVLMLPTARAFVALRGNAEELAEQVAATYTRWLREESRTRPGNLVVMPLLHLTDLWGPGYAGMNNAIKPLHDAAERFHLDTTRVYLRGQGMSGHAVWNLGLHYPTYFAAINPLAGGASYDFQRMRVVNLRNTLAVVWHDVSDKAVPVKLSRDLVAALRQNKVDVVYDETKNVGHVPGPDIDARLYAAMAARRREEDPVRVTVRTNRPDTAFGRVDWVQVWQPLDGAGEVRTIFNWSGTGMWSYNAPVTVDARLNRDRNRVEIEGRNVGAIRLLLHGRMLDLGRPIAVTLNGKPVYEGLVTPSVEATLRDQLSLGRGWRSYTAALDLDFMPKDVPATRPATAPATRP